MSDIMERLDSLIAADPQRWTKIRETAVDAKAEIERLTAFGEEAKRLAIYHQGLRKEAEAEIERLRAALEWIENLDPPIAEHAREKFNV